MIEEATGKQDLPLWQECLRFIARAQEFSPLYTGFGSLWQPLWLIDPPLSPGHKEFSLKNPLENTGEVA